MIKKYWNGWSSPTNLNISFIDMYQWTLDYMVPCQHCMVIHHCVEMKLSFPSMWYMWEWNHWGGKGLFVAHRRCYKNQNLPSTSCCAKKIPKRLFCEKRYICSLSFIYHLRKLCSLIGSCVTSTTMRGYFGWFLAKNVHDCPQNSQELWSLLTNIPAR